MTLRVLIAGGGTGGHVFPGIALAEELTTRGRDNEVRFVGTERGLEREAVPRAGFEVSFIHVAGLKRMGLKKTLAGLFQLPRAFIESWRLLSAWRPGLVVAVGGYASGPVSLVAWLRGIPVVVQEQNALPGFTTRVVSRFARKVFVAFEAATRHFPQGKAVVTGNPIRQALLENYLRPAPGAPSPGPVVLAFGGSLGARALNLALVDALGRLVERHPGLRLIHQTGPAHHDSVHAAYEAAGLLDHVDLKPFIHDMSAAYANADLVVCRAGATTLAELTVAHKASVLVPFPYAADNHQEHNARALSDSGAAVLLTEDHLTGERLAREIDTLLSDPGARAAMERRAGILGHPEAAREIIDACVDLWVADDGPEKARRWQARHRREESEG